MHIAIELVQLGYGLETNNIDCMDQAQLSPDLNPVKNSWADIQE